MIQTYKSGNRKPKDPFYDPKKAQRISIELSIAVGWLVETTSCFSKGNCIRNSEKLFSSKFSRFALYQPHSLPQPLPCIVIFLVHKKTNVARLMAQTQNGQTLMEATGGF